MKVFRHLNDDLYHGSVLMPLFLEMYTGVIGIIKNKILLSRLTDLNSEQHSSSSEIYFAQIINRMWI